MTLHFVYNETIFLVPNQGEYFIPFFAKTDAKKLLNLHFLIERIKKLFQLKPLVILQQYENNNLNH